MSDKKASSLDTMKNFAVGGLSGACATCVIQPIDLVKVRIQLASEAKGNTSPFKVASSIY
jgi:solute carrier family 25 oxoglutarate transporter 11